jgi:moderate conductance mechanosensitive channel
VFPYATPPATTPGAAASAAPEPAAPAGGALPCWQEDNSSLCRRVYEWTDTTWLAEWAEWLVAKPLRIVTILVVASLIRRLLRRTIDRLCDRAAQGTVPGVLTRGRQDPEAALAAERRKQRAATLASVLRSISTGVIYGIALLMVLSELTFNIGPLIASAGILGVALGFGAQSLVKDFLSGIFMILEDQYGVGDEIDLQAQKGIVEAVGLRVTRVRDVEGTVWYIRNGEILRVGNRSQGWARAVIDVEVPKEADLDRTRERLEQACRALKATPEFEDLLLEEPAVWGVQALTATTAVLRVVAKTTPGRQSRVARALRELVLKSLEADDAAAQATVRVRAEGADGEDEA